MLIHCYRCGRVQCVPSSVPDVPPNNYALAARLATIYWITNVFYSAHRDTTKMQYHHIASHVPHRAIPANPKTNAYHVHIISYTTCSVWD